MKYCKSCNIIFTITPSLKIGTQEGIAKWDAMLINCPKCGSTLVRREYKDPKNINESLESIDDICEAIITMKML
jgi:hypothetical protein